MTPEQIEEWGVAKATLAHWKAREAELRVIICDEMFGTKYGHFSIKATVGNLEVKAESILNMSVDEDILQQLEDDEKLTTEELSCFTRKVTIKAALRKIDRESCVWSAITEKSGMPQLSVKVIA